MLDIEEIIQARKNYFDRIKGHKHIVAFGAGSKGKQTAEILYQEGIRLSAFVDNNPKMCGKKMSLEACGESIDILSYKDMKGSFTDYCILITTVLKNAMEIYKILIAEGEKNEIFFCANPSKAENRFLSEEELKRDREKYQLAWELFDDGMSQSIFKEFLLWKATGNLQPLTRYTEDEFTEVFDRKILGEKASREYVDIGAYTGDSVCRFLAAFGGRYDNIYCVEPDENNFASLEKCVQSCRLSNVTMYQVALWEKKEKKVMFGCQGGNYESCNLFRSIEQTIGAGRKIQGDVGTETVIETETVDSLFWDVHPTLLKIDALASEMPILYGARELIRRDRPSIVMEYGTHLDYLPDMIGYLKELNPEYQFLLRQKNWMQNSRTVLYVVNPFQ